MDFGHGVTKLSVVIDGDTMKQLTIPVGGQDVDTDLEERLRLTYPGLQLTNHVRLIKERHCYASLEPRKQLEASSKSLNSSYELPDGTQVVVNQERALCLEKIFKFQYCRGSLAGLIKELIAMFPDNSSELSQNIVIVGGTTQCTNFNYRLLSELYKNKAASVVRIFCPPERSYTCWVGASIIYCDDDYDDKGMSFNEYNSPAAEV